VPFNHVLFVFEGGEGTEPFDGVFRRFGDVLQFLYVMFELVAVGGLWVEILPAGRLRVE
jgi:hypothetical protein